jgi:hypothetical protein
MKLAPVTITILARPMAAAVIDESADDELQNHLHPSMIGGGKRVGDRRSGSYPRLTGQKKNW